MESNQKALNFSQQEKRLINGIKKKLLSLFYKKTNKIFLTNQFQHESILFQSGITYAVEVSKTYIDFRYHKSDYKDHIRYMFDSHTYLYHERLALKTERIQFLKHLIKVVMDVKSNHVLIFREN